MLKRPAFHVVKTDAGWHVHYVAGNGRIVMSSEVYTSKVAALAACDVVRRGAPVARIVAD